MKYGLVGKKLSHSFSKLIHESISNLNYELKEVDDIHQFLLSKPFYGINVTIPYKTECVKYLDVIDQKAQQIGNVNTIINKNGLLYGYNTDYIGLKETLRLNDISLKNKKVLIIGNGSTSGLSQFIANEENASKIKILARNPKTNQHHLKDYKDYSDSNIIINTTPYGMYPNNETDPIFSLSQFKTLEAVIDLVYNPIKTPILIEADKMGIKAINGLQMLVIQAVKANELFTNKDQRYEDITKLIRDIFIDKLNIVLIGMPMSGKTHFAKLISLKHHKPLYDMDKYIEQKEKTTIKKIFNTKGELHFRDLELKYYKEIAKKSGIVISTGGGIIENNSLMNLLMQNGVIVFLDASLELLQTINPKNRPLLKNKENIISLYKKRHSLYNQYADIIINKTNFNEQVIMKEIEVGLNAYFSTKWT